MSTRLYVTVDEKHPEDDYLELAEILKRQFGEEHLKIENALVIETDFPAISSLFKSMSEVEKTMPEGGKDEKRGRPRIKYENTDRNCVKCGKKLVSRSVGNICQDCTEKKKDDDLANELLKPENEAQ